jgi:IS605 OrfB family transposase
MVEVSKFNERQGKRELTKTLRLRIVRPLFSEDAENFFKEEKDKRYNKKLKELGHEPDKKELKMLKYAKHISSNDKFWDDMKRKYPDMLTWQQLGPFLRLYQEKLAKAYNETIANLYLERIYKLNTSSGKNNGDIRSHAYKILNSLPDEKHVSSSEVMQGMGSKIRSMFRENDIKYNKISLPTVKADSAPVPFYKDNGFKIKNHNGDFVITLPIPEHELIPKPYTNKKGKDSLYYELKLTAPDKIGKNKKFHTKDITLILGTAGRKKNKTWSKDNGTDAEIRRLINTDENEKTDHQQRWLQYFENLQSTEKKKIYEDSKKKKYKWKTIKKEFNITEDEPKDNDDRAKWKEKYMEKYLKTHPYSEDQFKKDFLEKAKVSYLEITRGKKSLHGGTDWYVNFVINLPPQNTNVDVKKYGGIDLGYRTPLVFAVNDSYSRYSIKKNDVAEHNRRMRARTRILMKKNSLQRKGHGTKNKLKIVEQLNEKSEMFKRKIIERWAMEAVKFFKREGVGTVQMEDLSNMKDRHDRFFDNVLRISWPYAQMQGQIEKKLSENGIKVNLVDPSFTSQLCSKCKKLNSYFNFKYRRKKKFPNFKCKFCDYEENADYNGAKNISNPEISNIVSSLKKEKI